MAIQGSNELNMLLKARVVKIRLELDYKKSNLPSQINAISKWLSDTDKRIKLKVKLDFSVKDISSQLNKLHATLNSSKTFTQKPIKIPIQIDVKGSASAIKKQLKEVMDTINAFNKKYASQLQQLNALQQQTSNKGGKTTPATAPNIPLNQYMDSIKEAEKYMKGAFNKKGINGLFSTHELKDAVGNVNGFIATLTRADGVIQKIRYQWDANSGKFSPISRETVTQTEKTALQVRQAVLALTADIEKLKNGQGKENLFNEQNAILANKQATMDMVRVLQTKIKEEAVIVGQIKDENARLIEQKKLYHEITKLRDAEWKRTGDVSTRQQLNALRTNVKTNPNADLKEEALILKQIRDQIAEKKKDELELIANTKKRMQTLQEVRNLERNIVTSDKTSKILIGEIKLMAQRAKSAKDWIAIQGKMNSLKDSNANDRQIQKSLGLQHKMETQMRRLVELGRMTEAQFSTNMKKIALIAQRSFADLGREAEKVNNKLRTVTEEMKRTANQSKTIFGAGTGSANQIKSLVGTGDLTALQNYFGQMYKGKVQTMSMVETTDKLGRAVTEMKIKMAGTGKQVQTYTLQMERANGALRQVGKGMDYNANRNLGIMEQLKIAMARVPVWMVAMTAFYGTINSVKQMTQEIFKLDKALTELRRVASSSLSIDHIFKGSINLAKELGNNVHDVMQAVNDLSRTFGEMNERQLLSIARTATLMSNVSDLTAQEATNSLVGTMNAFNITAEESIHIVDALNEVDNDYAISTKQLAEGLQKSASTARTFGVTLEENVGHITAIGAVTMESGAIIGNSLKTIYSRLTTLKGSEEILKGVGVAIRDDLTGNVREVGDILGDLGDKWFELNDSQRQNIAVTVAGRYQLSRFIALMNNWEMASKATQTAINSEGSAMRENAEYMKSFEARINSLKNKWTEFSSAMGKAILSDGVMGAISFLGKLAEAGVWVANTIGALPVVFGGLFLVLAKFGFFTKLIGDVILFTSVFRTSMTVHNIQTKQAEGRAYALARAWNAVTASQTGVAATARAMGGAWKSALIGTGIGAAIVVIGIAIEKWVRHMGDQKRQAEETEKLNKKMVDSYRANRDGMDSMIERYDELTRKTKLSNEEQEELNKITTDFANQLPTTVEYIDANGKAHMKTTKEIRAEIKAVQELSREQATLTEDKFEENMEKQAKAFEDVTKKIEKLKKAKETLDKTQGMKEDEYVTFSWKDGFNIEKPLKDNTVAIQQNKVAVLMAEAEKTEAIKSNIKSIQAQTLAWFESKNELGALGDEQQKLVETFVQSNEQILRNAKPKDFNKAYLELYEMGKNVGKVFVQSFDALSEGIGDNPQKIRDIKTALGEVAKSVPETFFALTNEAGDTVKSTEDVVKGLKEIVNVSQLVKGGTSSYDDLSTRLQRAGMSANDANGFLKQLAITHNNASLRAEAQRQSVDGVTSSIEDMNEAVIEAIDLTGTLFGYTQSDVSSLLTHLQAMEALIDAHGETVGKQTVAYEASARAVAEFLGITTSEVEANFENHKRVARGLAEIDWSARPDDQSFQDYIRTLEDVDEKTKNLLATYFDGGASVDVFSGDIRQLTATVEENKEAVVENAQEIFDANGKVMSSSQAKAKAIREAHEQERESVIKTKLAFEEMFYTLTNKKGEKVVFTNLIKGATEVEGSFDQVQARYEKIQALIGNPIGNTAFDELISKLTYTDGQMDGTRENILILKEILENPAHVALLDGANASIDETKASADNANESIKQLKQQKIFDEQDASPKVVEEKVNAVGQSVDELKEKFRLAKLEKLFDEGDNSASTVKAKVEEVGKSADNIKAKFQEIKQQKIWEHLDAPPTNNTQKTIDDLTLAIQKASSSTKVLSDLNEMVGNSAKKVDDLLGKLANIATSTSGLSTSAGTVDAIKRSIEDLAGALIIAQEKIGGLINGSDGTFSNMSTSISNAINIILEAYHRNTQGLARMVQDAGTLASGLVTMFGINISKIVGIVDAMTSLMNMHMKMGADKVVITAGNIPKRIADAIRANLGYVTSAMKEIANTVANTKFTTPSIPKPKVGAYAKGGIVEKMELAWHGEEGAEAIIPLISKRRQRGLELWEEAGERLGINTEILDLLKNQSKRKSSGGQSYSGGGSFGATSGEGGVSGGGDSGTSGTLIASKPSYLAGSYDFNGNYGFHALAEERDFENEIADPFKIDENARILASWEHAIALLSAKMQAVNKNTREYRDYLKEIIRLENGRVAMLHKSVRDDEESLRLTEIRLSQLSNVNAHTKEQRDEYNKLQQEYENLVSKINSARVEIENANNKITQTGKDIFIDWISEITLAYDTMIDGFKDKVDNIEFAIEVASLVDPDNIGKQLDLLADKSKTLQSQLSFEQGKKDDLWSRLGDAISVYGSNSDQAKALRDEFKNAEEAWEDTTLAVLKNEKEIRDTRGKVADDGIGQLKDYYKNMQDMAVKAIELERKALEKAHDAKMKLYDEEANKINSIYDAKIKAMDADKAQANFEEQLTEKNTKKAELMNKITLLSRDNTLEGRKKLAELQSELADVNKDIAKFQKDRQDELLREQLEQQKQAQLSAVEAQKEAETLVHEEKLVGLDKDKEETEKYYNDMINDEKYWADMKSQFVAGNFAELTSELSTMSSNLSSMNQGNFDMLSKSFASFSDAVKSEIAELYGLTVDNAIFNSTPVVNATGQVDKTKYDFTNANVASEFAKYADFVDPTKAPPTPPPVEPTPAPPAPAPEPRYHTVKGGDTLWDLAQQFYGNPYKWSTIANANGSPDPRKLQIGRKLLIPFRDGGYTGDWGGDEGKVAMLHKKELVLNQRQTSDILNTAKIMDKIKGIIPNVNKTSVADKLAMASGITNITNIGDINVTVEGGDKKKAKDIAKEILTGLRKKGK